MCRPDRLSMFFKDFRLGPRGNHYRTRSLFVLIIDSGGSGGGVSQGPVAF